MAARARGGQRRGSRELGIEVVRAQRTSQALDAMAHEIKRRKKELPWGA